MPSPTVYLNGRYRPIDRAFISIRDQGVLYGHGCFDTMRAYGGTVFRLADHLDRLVAHAGELGIFIAERREEIAQAVAGLLRRNGLGDARIRVTVTAGEGGDGPMFPAKGPPTIFVTCAAIAPGRTTGYRAVTATGRRSAMARTVHLKSTSYLENLIARGEAKAAGAEEALFLNERGMLAEGAVSNLFFVRRGELCTPSLACGILPGVTRKVVTELARGAGMRVREGQFPKSALLGADEAFLTNAIIEVTPLLAVDGQGIGTGKPGSVTRKLQRVYADLVRKETGAR
jgi:branched-chain amino acid aminotransferase